ncbi:MAG TPA: response regulator transcription factor [Candidatus Limnocylindria bacterium]|jgi:two-component system phosphate regulon response regulator PhoB|nr:response regulator transcription factor [Candidatus Limnocylindria bacterium]
MEEALANLVSLTLQHGQYESQRAIESAECRRIIREWEPDLAFVDLDRYGNFVDFIGQVTTEGHLPILAFTRKRDTALKLSAFERGVEDIVEVPFTLDEIVARPYALMRRVHGIDVPLIPKIRLDGLAVDLIEQRVRVGGKDLQLTPIQQTLLYLLAANAGRVLSREELINSIWGGEFEIESNVVDRHIRELRVKLGDDWRTPQFIETVAGRGYRFKSQPD